MDKQEFSLHAETVSHKTAEEETWTGEDVSHNIIELRPVTFSAKAIQHGRHPANAGRMENPDAHASRVGWCGEVMEMYLRLDGDRIAEASFWADGCLSTMACGDMITTMVRRNVAPRRSEDHAGGVDRGAGRSPVQEPSLR